MARSFTGLLLPAFVRGHWDAASGSSSHTHSDWHLGHILSGDWEAWHPADRAAILNLLSPLGIKDMSGPHHPRAPFYSLVLFCLKSPSTPPPPIPRKKKQENKAAKGEERGGEGRGEKNSTTPKLTVWQHVWSRPFLAFSMGPGLITDLNWGL